MCAVIRRVRNAETSKVSASEPAFKAAKATPDTQGPCTNASTRATSRTAQGLSRV